MKTDKQANADMQHLADALQDHRVAMFTLLENDGTLSSRPMTALHLDAKDTVWFMASRKTWASLLAKAERPVNLALTRDGQYISLSGHASLVDDPVRKQALWTPAGRPWFSGPEDPELVLIAVRVQRAEIWDGPDNAVSRAIGMAASIVAGREVGLGHKDVIEPAASR
jgi:general stress protein 26